MLQDLRVSMLFCLELGNMLSGDLKIGVLAMATLETMRNKFEMMELR